MQEITLKLTVEEANLVLEALGNLPFARVYALVGKIQAQAAGQMKTKTEGASLSAATESKPEASK